MKKIITIFAAALAIAAVVSCNKDNKGGDENGGKADITVAKDNLVAWFPFEGNGVDKVANLTPLAAKEGFKSHEFTANRNGKALQGVAGGYLLYDLPEASKLRSLEQISIAMWLNQAPIPTTQAPVPCFFEWVVPDAFWGAYAMSIDRLGNEETPSDILALKTFGQLAAGDFWKTDGEGKYGFTGGRWIHVIFTYDGAGNYHAYQNGIDVTPEDQVAVVYQEAPAGKLNLSAATQLILGAWQNKVIGGANDEWMGDFLGAMDELRIYNKALSADEAKALYDAEVNNLD